MKIFMVIVINYLLYAIPLILLGLLIFRQLKRGGAIISEKNRRKIVEQTENSKDKDIIKIREFYSNKRKVRILNNIVFGIFCCVLSFFSVYAIYEIINFTSELLTYVG